jgi:hypothetical protein
MARDSSLTNRLTSRLDRGGLERVSVPGGGVAYRGETATRALNALGARAMTLDRSIIVADDFDPSDVSDQALFAHEQYHADHGDGGGGGGGENFADAEEVAARAVERMVLSRAAAGGYEGGDTPGAGGGATGHNEADGGTVGAGPQAASNKPDDLSRDPDAAAGYAAMRNKGMSHMDVVDEMARRVVDATDQSHEVRLNRAGDTKHTV